MRRGLPAKRVVSANFDIRGQSLALFPDLRRLDPRHQSWRTHRASGERRSMMTGGRLLHLFIGRKGVAAEAVEERETVPLVREKRMLDAPGTSTSPMA